MNRTNEQYASPTSDWPDNVISYAEFRTRRAGRDSPEHASIWLSGVEFWMTAYVSWLGVLTSALIRPATAEVIPFRGARHR